MNGKIVLQVRKLIQAQARMRPTKEVAVDAQKCPCQRHGLRQYRRGGYGIRCQVKYEQHTYVNRYARYTGVQSDHAF